MPRRRRDPDRGHGSIRAGPGYRCRAGPSGNEVRPCGPAQCGADPRFQRARRDVRARAGRDPRTIAIAESRRSGRNSRGGSRDRHVARHDQPRLHSVLHHQGRRSRRGRPADGRSLRPKRRRRDRHRKRARSRNDRHPELAGRSSGCLENPRRGANAMKLYYAPGACSLACRISLHEAGLAAEFERVDIKTKTTEHGHDYRAINPKGYVPMLVLDDGTAITENVAVLDFIAEHEPALAPAGPLARTRLIEMLSWLSTELHVAFKPFW